MKTTLDQRQAFVAVIDCGSITVAAERLAQTASGVSRTLRRLEQKLDTTLLRRTTRRRALAEEGTLFLDRYAFNQQLATFEAKSGILMAVHPAGFL